MGAMAIARKDIQILLRERGRIFMLFLLPLVFVVAFTAIFDLQQDDSSVRTELPVANGDPEGPMSALLLEELKVNGGVSPRLVAAENAMGASRTMNYDVVPGGIFTSPEVANVGLSEAQAKEQGHNVRADSVLFRTLGKAQVIGEIAGQAKIVSDAGNGKILGVHIIGPHATDLIAETID